MLHYAFDDPKEMYQLVAFPSACASASAGCTPSGRNRENSPVFAALFANLFREILVDLILVSHESNETDDSARFAIFRFFLCTSLGIGRIDNSASGRIVLDPFPVLCIGCCCFLLGELTFRERLFGVHGLGDVFGSQGMNDTASICPETGSFFVAPFAHHCNGVSVMGMLLRHYVLLDQNSLFSAKVPPPLIHCRQHSAGKVECVENHSRIGFRGSSLWRGSWRTQILQTRSNAGSGFSFLLKQFGKVIVWLATVRWCRS